MGTTRTIHSDGPLLLYVHDDGIERPRLSVSVGPVVVPGTFMLSPGQSAAVAEALADRRSPVPASETPPPTPVVPLTHDDFTQWCQVVMAARRWYVAQQTPLTMRAEGSECWRRAKEQLTNEAESSLTQAIRSEMAHADRTGGP